MRLSHFLFAAPLLLSSCAGPAPTPRYVLGAAYQAGGHWYYPREAYGLTETGLAAVADARHPDLTANGEAYDRDAMAAGHQTLQLPAIAQVTNLTTGAQARIRINDRGPARPHRMLELTPRAAALLGIPPAGGTLVRLEVLDAESRQAIEGLSGAPRLQIAAAPRESVRAESLGGPQAAAAVVSNEGQGEEAHPAVVTRLPETVTRAAPGPTTLWVRLGSFGRREFADRQSARVAHLAPTLETERVGRQTTYRLRVGPLASAAEADAILDQALRAGFSDARIVVE